jgi:hypothetical protein
MSDPTSTGRRPTSSALRLRGFVAAVAISGAALLAVASPATAQDQYGGYQGGSPGGGAPEGGQYGEPGQLGGDQYGEPRDGDGYGRQPGPQARGHYGQPGPARGGDAMEARFVDRHIRHIMRADANGDGRVSLREWMAWRAARVGPDIARRQFTRLDLNRDGYLTPDELQRHEARLYSHVMVARGGTQRGQGND